MSTANDPAPPPPSPPPGPAGKPPRRRRPRWVLALMGLVAVLLGILVLLVIAEVILRSRNNHQLHYARDVRYLFEETEDGVVTVAHFEGTQTIGNHTVGLHTNNVRMRRKDDLGPASADEDRVLVLGDSMVFGQGVEDEEAFPMLLEGILSGSAHPQNGARRVTVGNAGMIGSGVRDQLPPLIHALREFAPDVVVSCLFLGNDFTNELEEHVAIVDGFPLRGSQAKWAQDSWRFRFTYSSFVAFEVEHFLFANLPSLALRPPTLPPSVLPHGPPELTPAQIEIGALHWGEGLFMDRVGDDDTLPPHIGELWRRIRQSLTTLRDTAAPAPMLLVIIPSTVHTQPGDYAQTLQATRQDPALHVLGTAQRRLLGIAAELGIQALDLTPTLRDLLSDGQDYARAWIPGDRHFSVAGHQVVAETLGTRVRQLLR